MNLNRDMAIEIIGGEHTGVGVVHVRHVSIARRLFRAGLILLFWTVIAGCSIIIPLLHFVLPPIFLCVGVYLSIRSFRRVEVIGAGEGTCPYCEKPFQIYPRALAFPFSDVCSDCHRSVRIISTG